MPASSRRRSRKSPIFIRRLGLLDIIFASFDSLVYWLRGGSEIKRELRWPVKYDQSH
jgi:hypothetical protein